MTLENPFTPLFGQVPLCIAGREEFLGEMSRAFQGQPNNPNLSTLISGPRGTGKTVLLSRIAELAQASGWIVASVSACDGMLEDILQRTYEAGSHLLESPKESRLSSAEVGGVLGASWAVEPRNENWRSKMNRIFEQLSACNVGLLITVDEVNSACGEMITLATAYQHFLSEGKLVSLVMAGLPGNVSGLVNGKSTSFWRRAHRKHLDRISDDEVSAALSETLATKGAGIKTAALDFLVRKIDGFPYLLQLAGYWSFEDMRVSEECELSLENARRGIESAESDMRSSVLDATYADLSQGDIAFLSAMLRDAGPASMRDIASRMGVTQGYASQYRLRLIEQGVVGQRGRGKLDFEIPFFREYVQEMTGEASWPEEILGGNISAAEWERAYKFAESFTEERSK